MGPFLRSVLPVKKKEGDEKLPAFKRWMKVLFAISIIVTIPILAFLLFEMLKNVPRILASAWDSFGKQWSALADAWSGGHYGGVAFAVLQILLLALPVAGLGFALFSLGRTGMKLLWNWSKPTPARRAIGSLATAALPQAVSAPFRSLLIAPTALAPQASTAIPPGASGVAGTPGAVGTAGVAGTPSAVGTPGTNGTPGVTATAVETATGAPTASATPSATPTVTPAASTPTIAPTAIPPTPAATNAPVQVPRSPANAPVIAPTAPIASVTNAPPSTAPSGSASAPTGTVPVGSASPSTVSPGAIPAGGASLSTVSSGTVLTGATALSTVSLGTVPASIVPIGIPARATPASTAVSTSTPSGRTGSEERRYTQWLAVNNTVHCGDCSSIYRRTDGDDICHQHAARDTNWRASGADGGINNACCRTERYSRYSE